MSELKCPFCQQELKPQTMDGEWLECWNCSYHEPSHHPFPQRILCGTKELWQELIRTRKALDVAKDALNKYTDASGNWWYGYEFQGNYEDYAGEYADKALKQITALEQKDAK